MLQFQSVFPVLPSLLLLVLTTALPGSAYALEPYDDIQRRDLALVQSQLTQMTVVLKRLEERQAAQLEPMELYLDLPRLKADIRIILNGLDDYLSPSRMPPRHIEPLERDLLGEYMGRSQ